MNVDDLAKQFETAAIGFFKDSWSDCKVYMVPELKKLALTAVDIEVGLAQGYYTKPSAQVLWRMQLRALQSVILATTTLTLIELEAALNAILGGIADFLKGKLGLALP